MHKVSIENTDLLSICANFSKSTHTFANFSIYDREQNGTLTEMCEAL